MLPCTRTLGKADRLAGWEVDVSRIPLLRSSYEWYESRRALGRGSYGPWV